MARGDKADLFFRKLRTAGLSKPAVQTLAERLDALEAADSAASGVSFGTEWGFPVALYTGNSVNETITLGTTATAKFTVATKDDFTTTVDLTTQALDALGVSWIGGDPTIDDVHFLEAGLYRVVIGVDYHAVGGGPVDVNVQSLAFGAPDNVLELHNELVQGRQQVIVPLTNAFMPGDSIYVHVSAPTADVVLVDYIISIWRVLPNP